MKFFLIFISLQIVLLFSLVICYTGACKPVITIRAKESFGTLYQHKTGRMVFIPSYGHYSNKKIRNIWLATCVTDTSFFSINGYDSLYFNTK